MPKQKNGFHTRIFQKSHLPIIGVLLLLLLAVALLWFGESTSVQALPPFVADIYFEGEYRIGDGEWHSVTNGEHIPATKGDVTLRGNFHMLDPLGNYAGVYREEAPLAFYTDHISLTIYEVGSEPFVMDMENPLFGRSACGEGWGGYSFVSQKTDLVEIRIHNPHHFGNETAIDEMLSGVAIWDNIDFEKGAITGGEQQRETGILLILVAIVFLGIALFSSLIHIKNDRLIWLLGFTVLFAGAYFAYSASGVSFWSESIVFNTTISGISMMFYMFFLSLVIATFLHSTKRIGLVTVLILGASTAVFLVLPIVANLLFYDMLIYWIAVQLLANVLLAFCLIKEFVCMRKKERWIYIGALLPLIAFAVDVIGNVLGAWKGGIISQYVFVILFALAMIMVLRLIPHSINAAARARELENEKIALDAQLSETRISTMISQIRPHFVYNTLGSIEQLCKLDPPKAAELVHSFAKYLRGNFGELDNHKPILMSREMEHVHHYVSIERVRFPDMTFTFEMSSNDFHIPALTVQPIVENAIKHGLMKLPHGGTIRVLSYETDKAYCISVTDDGAGFDTNTLQDNDRKHVGLRNIRERLKVMVNGTLNIESTIGVGTKVLITIPKEVQK